METFLIKALQLIVALSMLIIIHEGGHYLFARLFGIKVEKFYLFFNPWFTVAKWKPKKKKVKLDKNGNEKSSWRDTEYGIGWLPLGGYVKIAGMIDESMDTEQMKQEPQAWEFRSKPAWQRLFVMLGGVFMNFILAIVIYIGMALYWGGRNVPLENAFLGFNYAPSAQAVGFIDGDIPLKINGEPIGAEDPNSLLKMAMGKEITVLRNLSDTVTIKLPSDFILNLNDDKWFLQMRQPVVVLEPMHGTPAAKAGLQQGDRVLTVNNGWAEDFPVFTDSLRANAGKEIAMTYRRGNDTIAVNMTPTSAGTIGIRLQDPSEVYGFEVVNYSFFQAIPVGIKNGVDKLTSYVSSLGQIFTKRGAQSVGGFGSIGQMFPEKWDWYQFWNMAALLSVILAFMNILPIPALDGGHAMFAIWEIVTRRKPSDKFLERAQMAGMMFLIALLLYANLNDIYKLFK